jgi:hypothetical protein
MNMPRALSTLLLIALLSACGDGSRIGGNPAGAPPPAACPSGGGSAVIDWVDFVKLEGTSYSSDHAYGEVTQEDLGEVLARTRCKLADVVTDPRYRSQDGDAGYLEPGTEIRELVGYDPGFRVSARRDGEWVIYEADESPDASVGRDLLDIEGRVEYISVNSAKDGTTQLGTIRDPEEVTDLVGMVSIAPVDQGRRPQDDEFDEQLFVEFHLHDGTSTSRAFFPVSRLLWRGIVVPQAFVEAVDAAVE